MLTGGKLADLLGRRLIFIDRPRDLHRSPRSPAASPSSATVLIGARVVQGVGAALMNPATLSIITATFPPRQRGMAIGIWAGVSALALAIGPLVGGLITEHINWNWIFFINVPVGVLVAIVGAWLFIDESRDTSREQRLDLPGPAHVGDRPVRAHVRADRGEHATAGRRRASSALFAVAVVSLVAFVLLELHQRVPMLDLSLFRNAHLRRREHRRCSSSRSRCSAIFFFVSLYMQNILGYSPIQAGAAFLPMTLLIVICRADRRAGSPTESARAG